MFFVVVWPCANFDDQARNNPAPCSCSCATANNFFGGLGVGEVVGGGAAGPAGGTGGGQKGGRECAQVLSGLVIVRLGVFLDTRIRQKSWGFWFGGFRRHAGV